MEPKNAIITCAEILIEDHNILTLNIALDYGGPCQSFGMYDNRENLSFFVLRIFEVLGVRNWSDLEGQRIRVIAEHCKVHAIGHYIQDKWFNPEKDIINS